MCAMTTEWKTQRACAWRLSLYHTKQTRLHWAQTEGTNAAFGCQIGYRMGAGFPDCVTSVGNFNIKAITCCWTTLIIATGEILNIVFLRLFSFTLLHSIFFLRVCQWNLKIVFLSNVKISKRVHHHQFILRFNSWFERQRLWDARKPKHMFSAVNSQKAKLHASKLSFFTWDCRSTLSHWKIGIWRRQEMITRLHNSHYWSPWKFSKINSRTLPSSRLPLDYHLNLFNRE